MDQGQSSHRVFGEANAQVFGTVASIECRVRVTKGLSSGGWSED